jgi:phosphopantothenoylcysteine decarboxylase/phosphopantothenate--cysteine ligase
LKNISPKKKTNHIKVLITAGPTFEKIDPVRFIGNRSSGKMGYTLADTFAHAGAEVTIISGPVTLSPDNKSIKIIHTESAQEMYDACLNEFHKNDIVIYAAAVADYTPEFKSDHKLKKKSDHLMIKLLPTKDIASETGKLKRKNQITVGFALETDNEIENAKEKIKSKNLDLIVLNSLNDKGAGFAYDTNKISIIDKYNKIDVFELKPKKEVAADIMNKILELISITK